MRLIYIIILYYQKKKNIKISLGACDLQEPASEKCFSLEKSELSTIFPKKKYIYIYLLNIYLLGSFLEGRMSEICTSRLKHKHLFFLGGEKWNELKGKRTTT